MIGKGSAGGPNDARRLQRDPYNPRNDSCKLRSISACFGAWGRAAQRQGYYFLNLKKRLRHSFFMILLQLLGIFGRKSGKDEGWGIVLSVIAKGWSDGSAGSIFSEWGRRYDLLYGLKSTAISSLKQRSSRPSRTSQCFLYFELPFLFSFTLTIPI